jgi:hypothetical protein
MNLWLVIMVLLYPITSLAPAIVPEAAILIWGWPPRLAQVSALASGLIIFLVLWLYALPRDLVWELGPLAWQSRFVLPLTAYLCGLVVAAVLMWWAKPADGARSPK